MTIDPHAKKIKVKGQTIQLGDKWMDGWMDRRMLQNLLPPCFIANNNVGLVQPCPKPRALIHKPKSNMGFLWPVHGYISKFIVRSIPTMHGALMNYTDSSASDRWILGIFH